MGASAAAGNWWELAIPLILLVIMVGMGLELTVADFRRVLRRPRAALVGFAGQMLLLPLVGLAYAHWPGFPPETAIGIVIITACPGGATSNVFSYLARANLALSVTLTALSCAACFLTIPLWVGIGLDRFAEADGAPELPLLPAAARLFVVTLLPVVVGMALRARWPEASVRLRAPLRRAMGILMGVALVAIVGSEWEQVAHDLRTSAWAALALVTTMLGLAWVIARATRLEARDAFTISIEVGLQNGALATMILVNLLDRPEWIVFPGTYAVLSFLPVTAWTLAMRSRWAGEG